MIYIPIAIQWIAVQAGNRGAMKEIYIFSPFIVLSNLSSQSVVTKGKMTGKLKDIWKIYFFSSKIELNI
jgi:hypothetical protein